MKQSIRGTNRKRWYVAIAVTIIGFLIGFIGVCVTVFDPSRRVSKAISDINEGNYTNALYDLESLDSERASKLTLTAKAGKFLSMGKYEDAIPLIVRASGDVYISYNANSGVAEKNEEHIGVGQRYVVNQASNGNLVLRHWDQTNYSFFTDGDSCRCNLNLKATYWTTEENENAKNIALGIKPYYNSERKTITYGLYPQDLVNDELIKAELEKLNPTEINGWYCLDGIYYAKKTAILDEKYEFCFSDGTTIKKDCVYWFVCKPIEWTYDREYVLTSKSCIDAHQYDGSGSNDYDYSDIRKWLENDFLNTAFSLGQDYLKTKAIYTDVIRQTFPNKETHESTFMAVDKIWLPTFDDIQYHNPRATDYALSQGAFVSNEKAICWTRTQGVSKDSSYVNGNVLTNLTIDGFWRDPKKVFGVCPKCAIQKL